MLVARILLPLLFLLACGAPPPEDRKDDQDEEQIQDGENDDRLALGGVAEVERDTSLLPGERPQTTSTAQDLGQQVVTPTVDRPEPNKGWIGSSCSANQDCRFAESHCLTDDEGFPAGTCTTPCTEVCPKADSDTYALTACVDAMSIIGRVGGFCLMLCNTNMFESGCREGYSCVKRLQIDSTVYQHDVCLPTGGAADQQVTSLPGGSQTTSGDWQTEGVEAWRPLVEKYFEPEDLTWAMNVMKCESGGNPSARNSSSGASGLFQHMPQYWSNRSNSAGWAGSDVFDPEANIAVAAWLFYNGGPQHWSCKG